MTSCLRIVLFFSVTISFIVITNSASTKQTTNFGYCMSDPGSSPVYFSNVIDFGTNGMIDANPIQNEFVEYLRGRFESRTSGPFGAQCPTSAYTRQQGIAMRRDYENQLRQSNKQIVEVDWTWVIDPNLVATAGFQHRMPRPGPQLPVDNSFCFSESYGGTLYVAGPAQTGSSVSMSNFNIGFNVHSEYHIYFGIVHHVFLHHEWCATFFTFGWTFLGGLENKFHCSFQFIFYS